MSLILYGINLQSVEVLCDVILYRFFIAFFEHLIFHLDLKSDRFIISETIIKSSGLSYEL